MLYDASNPIIEVVGVEHVNIKSDSFEVNAREYSALSFRIGGSTTVTANNTEYHINTNDVLYMPQGVAYTAEYTETEMLAIHFITAKNDSQIEVYSFQNPEEIYKLFMKAHSLWQNKEPGFEVYTIARLYTILGAILESKTKAALPSHFLNAVAFINSNYKDSNLTIDKICNKAGIGATVFRQLFRKHYDKTPTEYITDLRLEYARNLIAGGETIENAALKSGFNDPKYFARVVKARLGCTPRELKSYGK